MIALAAISNEKAVAARSKSSVPGFRQRHPVPGHGAVVERIDPAALPDQDLVHPRVDALDVLDGVEAPLDAGLVRDADHEVAVGVEEPGRFRDAFVDLQAVGVREVLQVRVDGAVAIHEDGPTVVPVRPGRNREGGSHHRVAVTPRPHKRSPLLGTRWP